jgi:hypothetical protein
VVKTLNDQTIEVSVTDGRARDIIASCVEAVLASSATAPLITIALRGESLPATIVAALISGLRRLREVGGVMVVVPKTFAVRDALALHGLDRVFAAPLDPDRPAAPKRKSGWQPSRSAAAVLALVAVLLGWSPANADVPAPLPPVQGEGISNDVAMILDRVIERNPQLTSYQGRMHVDIALQSFPFFHEHLDATTYYKRPSNYEVVFDHLPGYAHGFEKLYTDIGDPSNWAKHFVITYAGETPYQNRQDVTLRMVQRVRGMIDHETVLIDPEQFTIDQIRYDYYNGGHITMSQEFRPIAGYYLLASQRAEIDIPHVRAIAKGHYDGYQTNVALDDAVFVRPN